MEICQFHEGREQELHLIRSAVDKHSGQWRMLLVMIGFFVATSTTLIGLNYKNQISIQESVASIDKTVSSYIAVHKVETSQMFGKVEDLDERVHALED